MREIWPVQVTRGPPAPGRHAEDAPVISATSRAVFWSMRHLRSRDSPATGESKVLQRSCTAHGVPTN